MKLCVNLTVCADTPGVEAGAVDTDAGAVLIFGRTAADWLLPICNSRISTDQLIFLPLSERGSGDVFGAIVAGAGLRGRIQDLRRQAGEESAGSRLPIVGYRCLVGRLFIPGDAALSPEVSEEELRALLPVNERHRFVWHPATGLIEYETDEVLSAVDLLSSPVQTGRNWNVATPGEQLNLTLRSLKPLTRPEDVVDVIFEGRGSIGSAAAEIQNAPRAPNELPETLLGEALRLLKLQIAKAVYRMTDALPSSPQGSQLLGRLHAWAESLVKGGRGHSPANPGSGLASRTPPDGSPSLSTRQENELKRLLHMLEKEPDEGLKYALPVAGNSFRGTTTPTDRLSEERPDFDIGKLNRSGAGSVWQASHTMLTLLTRRYQELAQRELRLGNHRRAAYIYAMLLNDLVSAASVLAAGRMYRDAAAIYHVHLQQPRIAAEFYKRGGLWEEASAIFRELRQWRDAAELFRMLGRPELAAEMYEQELQELIEKQQFPAAAAVAIDFLGDRSRGLQLLRDGWSSGHQNLSKECLVRLFQQHADAGEHELMEEDVQRLLVDAVLTSNQQESAVIICSEQATRYPAARVRDLLRIQTWQIASSLIAGNPARPSQIALRAIRNLAEQDELLQRDAARCSWPSPLPAKPAVKSGWNTEEVQVSRKTSAKQRELAACSTAVLTADRLPRIVRWMAAITSADYLFCLGVTPEHKLVVARWLLQEWQQPGECVNLPIFDPEPRGTPQLRLNPLRSEQVHLLFFPATLLCVRSTVSRVLRCNSFVGTTASGQSLTFDLGFSPDGSRYSLGFAELNIHIVELDLKDRQDNSHVSFQLLLPEPLPECLIEGGGRVWLQNSTLVILTGRFVCHGQLPAAQRLDKRSSEPLRLKILAVLDSDFTAFAHSHQWVVPRLLITTRTSCYVVWLNSAKCSRIAEDMLDPHVCWTRNGIAVIASVDKLSCYRVTRKSIELLASGELSGNIVSMHADSTPDHVLVLDELGTMRRFRLPIE